LNTVQDNHQSPSPCWFHSRIHSGRKRTIARNPEEKWEVNIDGSFVKGAGGVGVVFKMPECHLLKHAVRLQYSTTNNEAEYEALLIGLCVAKALGATTLKVQSDSQLVVGQVNGEFEAKEDRMTKYLSFVRDAITRFNDVDIVQIPRE
jgi:ribonuclease HI